MVKKLKIFNNFNIPGKFKKSIILIGNFDGLHSGHQKLFELAKKYKIKYKSKVGVVTFDPIPKMFFNTKIKNYRISNFSQKVIYLKLLKTIKCLILTTRIIYYVQVFLKNMKMT